MKKIALELENSINNFYLKYKDLDEEITSIILSNNKWSLKQIIGHLLDSASNNHQRFIRLQLKDQLTFSDYNKDEWLKIERHNQMNFLELISLFFYYNKILKHFILNCNKNCLQNKWLIKWDENSDSITLKELIIHYLKHLKDHIIHFNERYDEIIKNGS